MTFKPFESKSLMDRRKSTKKDYPPKRKLPSNNETFTEMEQYHFGNYRPWGENPIARKVNDDCRGRVLRPVTQETWPCTGETRQAGDSPPQFQVGASGGVGALTYSLDPRWREVNEAGDQATIDENGIIQIGDEETAICSGPWPPWLIYKVCDDCGCSHGTIWLEDCSGDCDPCAGADCAAGLSVTGSDTIQAATSEQYTFNNAQGDITWSVNGEVGASGGISDSGLLSIDTGANGACGTLEVVGTDSCCGSYSKSVKTTGAGTGYWANDNVIWDTTGACGCPGSCQEIVGVIRHSYCTSGGSPFCYTTTLENSCITTITDACGCGGAAPYIHVTFYKTQEWICIP